MPSCSNRASSLSKPQFLPSGQSVHSASRALRTNQSVTTGRRAARLLRASLPTCRRAAPRLRPAGSRRPRVARPPLPSSPACARAFPSRQARAHASHGSAPSSLPISPPDRLGECDVLRLRALGALLGLVLHLRVLREGLVALADDRAVVDEQVLAAVVGRDEAIALVGVEPLDGSGCHFRLHLLCDFRNGQRRRTVRIPVLA